MTRPSLRLTIGALSAVSVGVVAAITLAITLASSFAALYEVGTHHAEDVVTRATDHADEEFRKVTGPAASVLDMAAGERWPWPSDDPATLALWTWALKQSYTRFSPGVTLSMHFADGTSIALHPSHDNASQYEVTVAVPTPYSATYPNQTAQSHNATVYDGATHDRVSIRPSDDPFVWLRDTPVWADYLQRVPGAAFQAPSAVAYPSGAVLYVRLAARVYRAGLPRTDLNVYAFLSATVAISDFSLLLRGMPTTPNTATFALDGARLLLGTSTAISFQYSLPLSAALTPAQASACFDTSTEAMFVSGTVPQSYVCRMSVSEYPHEELNAVAEHNPELLHATGTRVVREKVAHHRLYVGGSRLHLRYPGLEVYLVVLMPESDILGDVEKSRDVGIGITCGLVVLVAAVNACIVSVLLAPLQGIAKRMHDAANLEDDSTDRELSAMSEVADLQAAYLEMNDELNRIRSFVPQSVLAARNVGDDDDGEGDIAIVQEEKSSARSEARVVRTVSASSQPSERSLQVVLSGVSGGSSGSGGRISALASETCTARPVTVVVLNLVGLHAAGHRAGGGAAFAREISAATERVEKAVAPRGGVLTFHGDRFFVTFNAVKRCAGHATKAAAAAVAIAEAGTGGPLDLRFTAGIATGPCEVGAMGSSAVQSLATVGPAVTHAAMLERYSRARVATDESGSGAVHATYRTSQDASTAASVRYTDFVLLPSAHGGERPTLIAAVLPRHSRSGHATDPRGSTCSSAPGGGGGGGDDEWMYVLEAQEGGCAAWNACFEHIAARHFAEAVAAFDKLEHAGAVQPSEASSTPPPARLQSFIPIVRQHVAASATPSPAAKTDGRASADAAEAVMVHLCRVPPSPTRTP